MSTLTADKILVDLSAPIVDGKHSFFQVLGSSESYGCQLRQLTENKGSKSTTKVIVLSSVNSLGLNHNPVISSKPVNLDQGENCQDFVKYGGLFPGHSLIIIK